SGDWVASTPWIEFLARDPALRSNPSVCLKVVDPSVGKLSAEAQAAFVKGIAAALEKEGIAYDIDAYRDAPPGLRIWCGSTVERADVEALTLWLGWAFAETKDALPKAAGCSNHQDWSCVLQTQPAFVDGDSHQRRSTPCLPKISSPMRSLPPPCRSSRIGESRSTSSRSSAPTRRSSPRSLAISMAWPFARPPR